MIFKSAFIGLATVAALIAGTAEAATTLRVTTCVSKIDDQVKTYFKYFFDPVDKAKNGIKLRYIGGPEVTPRTKQGAALMRGIVDMIHCPSSYYAGMVPEARVLLLSNRAPWELRKNGTYDMLQTAWAKGLNAHFLAWPHWGGSQFHIYLKHKVPLSKKTGLDLTGVRVRSTAAYNPFLKVMEATPVVISAGDVYTALQRGVVDGFAWPEGSVAARGWDEYVKYRYGPGFWRSSTAVVVNLDKWKSLSKKDRSTLTAAALEYERTSGPGLRHFADIDNAKVFAHGVKKIILKGAYRKAYLSTINNAVWTFVGDTIRDKLAVPFDKLKAGLYRE